MKCCATLSRSVRVEPVSLQKFQKPFNGETRVANNSTESERVDGVVPRNRENSCTVRHDDVLTLAHDGEASLLKGTHHIEVIDAGNSRQD
jgi:hypothetical protein